VSHTSGHTQVTAEAKQEDIVAMHNGKISGEEFGRRIRYHDDTQKKEATLDYKVFAGVIETVLNNSEEIPFRVNGHINYSQLDGFGVIYSGKLRNIMRYSVMNDEEDFPTLSEGQQKKMNEHLDKLERELKVLMLDYGRSLRSLKDDQFILLNLQLVDRSLTRKWSVKAKKEVINKYDNNLLTRDKALAEIRVTEE
jgi:hypothetical protein